MDSDHADAGVQAVLANGTANATANATEGQMGSYHQPTEEELQHSLVVFYVVMFTMIFAQSALVSWRRRHRRSYELVTLVGLWLIPPVICVYFGLWRFLSVWSVYSAATGYFLYCCTFARGLDKSMPKRIYTWFYGVFKTSVAVGVVGYALLIAQVFGAGAIPAPLFDPGFALVILWYGLYFGILNRDCAEVASDRIANRLGGARRLAVSVRDCGICGGELRDAHALAPAQVTSRAPVESVPDPEASVQLSCKHLFHPECIRGWLIIGKKDCCPTCSEKVDLRALYAGKPWETRNLSWIQMLDMVRYLVVWQPTILVALHFALHLLHLDESPDHGGGAAAGGNATLALNGSWPNVTSGGMKMF